MADSQLYFWMVKRGQVRLWRDGDSVFLKTDTESADECELTQEDALEIATLLYHLAHKTEGY